MNFPGNYFFQRHQPGISFLVIIHFCTVAPAIAQPHKLVHADNFNIQYEGRVKVNHDSAVIFWPGSSIKIQFTGNPVSAILKDEKGNNYYNVIVDNESISVLKPDSVKRELQLSKNRGPGKHTLELFRRTGCGGGKTWFYGFVVPKNGRLYKVPDKKRRIEFYGNSITAGAGMYPEESKYGHENNYQTYAALTARHFNASYSCIARSGIGLMVSWFPMTMPDMYYRTDPFDSTTVWDFARQVPDIVVINLFQNDCALLDSPNHPEFKRKFGNTAPGRDYIVNAYKNFIQKIRGHYPAARIICVLGDMDAVKEGSPWPGYIEDAVRSLSDTSVYTHFFPYKNTPDHPNEKEHRQMAQSLIHFIEKNIQW